MTKHFAAVAVLSVLVPFSAFAKTGAVMVGMIVEPGADAACSISAAQARAIVPDEVREAAPAETGFKTPAGQPCPLELMKALRLSSAACVQSSAGDVDCASAVPGTTVRFSLTF